MLSTYFRYPENQTSQAVSLEQGYVYYMEGLLKVGSRGDDHFSVGVELPSGTVEKPIENNVYMTPPPGKYLNYFVLKCFFYHGCMGQNISCKNKPDF